MNVTYRRCAVKKAFGSGRSIILALLILFAGGCGSSHANLARDGVVSVERVHSSGLVYRALTSAR